METKEEKMKVSLDRFCDPWERPWGYREAKWEDLKDIDLAIHYEGKEYVEAPGHWDVVKRIL